MLRAAAAAYLDSDRSVWREFEPVLALWLQLPLSILFLILVVAGRRVWIERGIRHRSSVHRRERPKPKEEGLLEV